MELISFNYIEIEKYFQQAEDALLNSENEIREVRYLNKDPLTFLSQNLDFFDNIKENSIVYCLWIKILNGQWESKYIGHVHKDNARQRIINHLSKKHHATGAKLFKVTEAINNEHTIGFTFVKVTPCYMRKPLEEWLINKHRETLEWNISGKRIK